MNPLGLAIAAGYALPGIVVIAIASSAIIAVGLAGLGAAALIQKIVDRK